MTVHEGSQTLALFLWVKSMFSAFELCCAVPHNVLKSLVLVFFQALRMEIERSSNVLCALTDYEPVAGLRTAFKKHWTQRKLTSEMNTWNKARD